MSTADAVATRLELVVDAFTRSILENEVWRTDVAGLSRDGATELMRWSARALLQSAIATQRVRPA